MSPTDQKRQLDLSHLEELRARQRAATVELQEGVEAQIACALLVADEATGLWWEAWEKALVHAGEFTNENRSTLVNALESASRTLEETLRQAGEDARLFDQPVARFEELSQKAGEFPLWVRECLARWDMLAEAPPPLDADRIARARANHARGEHESLEDVLSRIAAGGSWTKE